MAASLPLSCRPPIRVDLGSRPTAEVGAASELRKKPRVVLLDDEPSILKTWKAILEANDYEVTACERAVDALAAIANGCDCVITDYHMPDMTGIEVIVAGRLTSRAPFIVMSGNDSPKLRASATAAGATCVLSKPVPIKHVIEIIEKLCVRTQAEG